VSSRIEELPDAWVAIGASRAFESLVRQPVRSGLMLAVRRPLLVAFILACDISLIAADPFNPRLIASATIYWAYVPLSEAVGLLAVCCNSRGSVPLSRFIDLYFTGHAPWLLWFTAVSVAWSMQAPTEATSFMFIHGGALLAGSAAAAVWSALIDQRFFRVVLGRPPLRAVLLLLIQRLISWSLILAAFSWATLLTELSVRLAAA
jgi:hypothetical protein